MMEKILKILVINAKISNFVNMPWLRRRLSAALRSEMVMAPSPL